MRKIAILIVTYTKFDFLVQPLIDLINRFWLNHPPIFVVGTERIFINAETINIKGKNLIDWVSNYYAGLKFLHDAGFTSFYLTLDDLHPIDYCDADYLNNYLPEKAENYQAGYVYLMAHFNLLKTCGESENGWLHLKPQSPYSISLQVGYWNLDYALLVTERIQREGIKDIWNYEVQGSLLDFSDHRPNFILKQGVKCLLADRSWQNLPESISWHISRTPYPFVRGGFLYQGRSTPITRRIYRGFLGDIGEIQNMINTTTTLNYQFQDCRRRVKRRVKRKLQMWKILRK